MLVSDRKRFIFVHNPKAAGSSVRSALAQYDDRNNVYWDHEDNVSLGRILDKAHITLDDFSVYSDSSLIEDYFVFGFVRNPYSRVYSAFHEKNKQLGVSGDTDFNEFIQTELNEINIRFDWKYIHFCPQYFFFYRGGKCKADFIGHFESLRRDYARAVNLAKIDADTDLPRLNRMSTEKSDSGAVDEITRCIEQYDPTSLSIVNRLYDRDFVYFGYQKFFGDSADTGIEASNARIEWVYKQTRYIKGEEAFYAARVEKLLEEIKNLQEKVEATQTLRDELQISTGKLQASRDELQAAKSEVQTSRNELHTALREIEGLRNSLSWKMTKPLRRLRNLR